MIIDVKVREIQTNLPTKIANECLKVKGLIGPKQKYTSFQKYASGVHEALFQMENNMEKMKTKIDKVPKMVDEKVIKGVEKGVRPVEENSKNKTAMLGIKLEDIVYQINSRDKKFSTLRQEIDKIGVDLNSAKFVIKKNHLTQEVNRKDFDELCENMKQKLFSFEEENTRIRSSFDEVLYQIEKYKSAIGLPSEDSLEATPVSFLARLENIEKSIEDVKMIEKIRLNAKNAKSSKNGKHRHERHTMNNMRRSYRRKVRSSFSELKKPEQSHCSKSDIKESSVSSSSVSDSSTMVGDFRKNNENRKKFQQDYKMSCNNTNDLLKISQSQDLRKLKLETEKYTGCRSPQIMSNWHSENWSKNNKSFFQKSASRFKSRENMPQINSVLGNFSLGGETPILRPNKKITTKNLLMPSPEITQINIFQGTGIKFEPLEKKGELDRKDKMRVSQIMSKLGKSLF